MLAAYYESAGDSTVLKVGELETPKPRSGQVRVRMVVAGVNPTDWKSRTRTAPPEGGFLIPGQDGAGVIDAVGPGVDQSRIGERVWLLLVNHTSPPWGTTAEYAIVAEEHAVPLPEGVSYELGASLGVPALTAWHCLMLSGHASGKIVLVAGGAGAVGHAAIELARYQEAEHVIATVSSPEKAQLAREAGAQTIVNYREPDADVKILEAAPTGVDRIVEVDLARNLALDLKVAAPHAAITTYAGDPDTIAEVPVRELMSANITLRFMLLYMIRQADLAAAINGVQEALKVGALTCLPTLPYTLEQTAAAHDAVQRGAIGKVLIDFRHDGELAITG